MKETNVANKIIIAERDNIAAVVENGKVAEFYVHRGEIILGDVYLAQVENILPSIEAAFVNVGSDKMGFLHAQDIPGKGALQDKVKPKQKMVVQVVKEPVGHKGPRVTTEISLPGRFLVLMPNETGINVSKKITSAKERARLKSVVNLLKPVGVGIIVRTEAEGQTEADIQEDLEILLEKWNNIVTSAESLTPPNLLYRDQDLLYRVIRECCNENTQEIIVDTGFALSRVQNILQNWHMNKNINVTLYKGSEPLLVAMDIHKEIKAALSMKVNLPSGGYLFIQTTEALTVIDVNSGKFTNSATQDETILKTNIEAVHEIARQLRLRNIGGMIIIDFIDMNSRVDKLTMMEELEIAVEADKAKPQVGQLSDLGLVEMTRHRQGQAISEIFAKRCPHCQGNGYIMEDIKFASATSEGEYRAKAAKLKLPMGNKKNKFNKFNNKPETEVKETPIVQEEKLEEVTNPSVEAQAEVQEVVQEKETKKRNSRKPKFDKKKVKQEVSDENLAQTVLTEGAEIEPVIAPQPEVAPVVEETLAVEAEAEEAPKKTTRGRRPNRGTQKRTRTTKKKTEAESTNEE
ncbi:MAG: Rne/Rng family ribonuclease [Candidatus Gastranaerophilales bacterium]|nr:Rne/Rng family ribonuclease [Candidatus Gastranaerophilales bacterium]MCM1073546.1 Rne/Rng family ribonuclease [Bacteroides sp.]